MRDAPTPTSPDECVPPVSLRGAEPADTWLRELARRRWSVVCVGPRTAPVAVAAFRRRDGIADVVVLRAVDRAVAYRAPVDGLSDPLSADRVMWHHESDAATTLRAVLMLPPPDFAIRPYPIPDGCRTPEIATRPITIRL